MSKKSCLVNKLSHYRDLTDHERELLKHIQRDECEFKRGDIVRRQGLDNGLLYVVKAGWFGISRLLPDGESQLVDVKLPGDVVGLEEVGFSASRADIIALSDGVLCPFPANELSTIFSESIGLTELFFVVTAREQSLLLERIVNLAQRHAIERVAHFILEIEHRLLSIHIETSECFEFPLLQHQVADMLGMTPVHINRTIQDLRRDGLLEWKRDQMLILDNERLQSIAKFDASYFERSIAWLSK